MRAAATSAAARRDKLTAGLRQYASAKRLNRTLYCVMGLQGRDVFGWQRVGVSAYELQRQACIILEMIT